MLQIITRQMAPVLILLTTIVMVSGCGGGGGGGSGSSLNVTPSSITFTAKQNGVTPSSQSVAVSWNDPAVAGIAAGYPPGSPWPSWFKSNGRPCSIA